MVATHSRPEQTHPRTAMPVCKRDIQWWCTIVEMKRIEQGLVRGCWGTGSPFNTEEDCVPFFNSAEEWSIVRKVRLPLFDSMATFRA